MTIEHRRTLVLELEKYLKRLSVQQANKGNQRALQTQAKTRAFQVMEGSPKGVLADAVKVDHLSGTATSSLGIWTTRVRAHWCLAVVGNRLHPLGPKGSIFM